MTQYASITGAYSTVCSAHKEVIRPLVQTWLSANNDLCRLRPDRTDRMERTERIRIGSDDWWLILWPLRLLRSQLRSTTQFHLLMASNGCKLVSYPVEQDSSCLNLHYLCFAACKIIRYNKHYLFTVEWWKTELRENQFGSTIKGSYGTLALLFFRDELIVSKEFFFPSVADVLVDERGIFLRGGSFIPCSCGDEISTDAYNLEPSTMYYIGRF